MVSGFSQLRRKMRSPTSITDKDLVELTLILQEALEAQEKGFFPTGPMMSAFTNAIYNGWNLDHLLDSPLPLEEELCRNYLYSSDRPSTPQNPDIGRETDSKAVSGCCHADMRQSNSQSRSTLSSMATSTSVSTSIYSMATCIPGFEARTAMENQLRSASHWTTCAPCCPI